MSDHKVIIEKARLMRKSKPELMEIAKQEKYEFDKDQEVTKEFLTEVILTSRGIL